MSKRARAVRRRSATIASGLLCAAAMGGCGQLGFRSDSSLRFLAPANRSRVSEPLRIRWRIDRHSFHATGFDGSGDAHRGAFMVFVDATPMVAGKDINSLARGDRVCELTPRCPDKGWLENHGIYITTRPHIDLQALPVGGGRPAGGLRRHEITVVLLNGRGVRIGEAAWTLLVYSAQHSR